MARVVQRRTNPPYLLIIFVFLFLVSTTLAVMFYINQDNEHKSVVQKTDELARLATVAEMSSAQTAAMAKSSVGTTAKTVLGQKNQQINDLASAITPENPDYGNARTAADEVYTKIKSNVRRGLVAELVAKNEQYLAAQALAEQSQKNLTELQKEKDQLDQKYTDLDKHVRAEQQKLRDQILELGKQTAANHDEYGTKAVKIADEFNAKIADYEKNITDKAAQIAKLQDDNRKQAKLIEEYKKTIEDTHVGTTKTVQRPDGKIVRVLDSEKLCYITLGSNDHINVGLTLAVYPASGIPEDGKPKARLRVSNVSSISSECMITEESIGDPVAIGDLVANLAYDTNRKLTFVVEGLFDLRGTGQPSTAGTDEVREMIKRQGGTIANTLDIHTDYIVFGDPPPKPAPLKPENTEEQVKAVFLKQQKARDDYDAAVKAAAELRIPSLNANRFLDLVGYMPPKSTEK